jgi:hypothetical protein
MFISGSCPVALKGGNGSKESLGIFRSFQTTDTRLSCVLVARNFGALAA